MAHFDFTGDLDIRVVCRVCCSASNHYMLINLRGFVPLLRSTPRS